MAKVIKFEYIPKDELCRHCKVRRATKLCDFENGLIFDAPGDKNTKVPVQISICSSMICDKCSTKIMYDKDICPNCVKQLKRQLKIK